MVKKEIASKVIKLGEDYAIPLPLEFCNGTTLEEGTELKVIYNERGNLEVQVNKLTGGDVDCGICSTRKAKYECSNCGTIACSTCFWEWGGLCNKCVKQ
jgi:hypothetical protein